MTQATLLTWKNAWIRELNKRTSLLRFYFATVALLHVLLASIGTGLVHIEEALPTRPDSPATVSVRIGSVGLLSRPVAISDPAVIVAGDGHALRYPIARHFWLAPRSDFDDMPRRARTRLFENGVELGPGHSPHAAIVSQGKGQFSHWEGELLFSSLDNASPALSGRVYKVRYSLIPGWAMAAAILTFSFPAYLVVINRLRHRYLTRKLHGIADANKNWRRIAWRLALFAVVVADLVAAALLAGLVRIEERVSSDSTRVEKRVNVGGRAIPRSPRHVTAITSYADNAYIFHTAKTGSWLNPWSDAHWMRYGAKTKVFEHDSELGPARTSHDAVINEGRGRFSHWDTYILFSASDNTDALTNGREYRFEYALRPSTKSLQIVLAGNFLCIAFGIAARRPRGVSSPHTKLAGLTLRSGPYLMLLGVSIAGVFAYRLVTEWMSGVTRYTPIGGFLPWSDAGGWLLGATHFLHAGELLDWPMRRPLFAVYLAFLSYLSGEDIRITLALNAAIGAFACFLFCAWMRLRLGIVAPLMGALLLSMFGIQYAGTTLSESFGFPLGAIAFALMFIGIDRNSLREFGCGYFLFAIAMSARPGPVVALATILFWAVFIWKSTRGDRLRTAAVLGAGLGSTAILTLTWAKIFGAAVGTPGANFAFTLYGLSVGGKSWEQFSMDFPLSHAMTESAQAALAYKESFAQIMREPSAFLLGYFQFVGHYLSHFFDYVGGGWLQNGLVILALVGVIHALMNPRDKLHSFVLVAAIGAIMSAGLTFWSSDAVRAFIATAPLDAMFVAIGLGKVLQWAGVAASSAAKPFSPTDLWLCRVTLAAGGLLVLACTIFPLAATWAFRDARLAVTSCPAGEHAFAFQAGHSSPFIHIVDESASRSWPPDVRRADFMAGDFSDHDIESTLRSMKKGDYLVFGYKLNEPLGSQSWQSYHRFLYIPARTFPEGVRLRSGAFYQLCGVDSPSYAFLLDARSVAEISMR